MRNVDATTCAKTLTESVFLDSKEPVAVVLHRTGQCLAISKSELCIQIIGLE
jgi:hypothetical protein